MKTEYSEAYEKAMKRNKLIEFPMFFFLLFIPIVGPLILLWFLLA